MRDFDLEQAILNKHKTNLQNIGNLFPHVTENGLFDRREHCFWTGGFWAGLSRLCYEISGENSFYLHADEVTEKIAEILRREGATLGHDIGMLLSPSAYAAYHLKQDKTMGDLVVEAAEILSTRFHEEGNYIQAWDVTPGHPETEDNAYRMIVDCLLNLPLLYRATELSGNPKYADIANRHAETARRYLVRQDGTTNHTFIFYPNGQPKHPKTHQGHSNHSCWSRGQGWAIMGFALAYRFTKNLAFLKTAILCADAFLRLTEPNGIPKWDFDFKGKRGAPRDTSAAAIVGCGLMEIYDATGDEKWKNEAERIFLELTKNYSTFDSQREEGMIREATGFLPAGLDINISLVYGDYYYVELYARLIGVSRGYW